MGFVDRGGGREAKGTSLRVSKKNPGAPSTKNKNAHRNYVAPTTRATPTPPATCVALVERLAAPNTDVVDVWKSTCATAARGVALYVDTAVALLSRKLEDDQEGIFRRAVEEGKLAGALCWSIEVEKQALLLDRCVQHNKLYRGAVVDTSSAPAAAVTRHVRFEDDVLAPSPVAITGGGALPSSQSGIILYAILGVHVNSVDRVNTRLHEQWIKDLEENVKHGEVVGVLSGLNLSRDHGTHYAQERLLKECWRVAAEARLPLVLHLYAADAAALTETVNRASELIQELLSTNTNTNNSGSRKTAAASAPSAIVLYNGLTALHASPAMQQLVRTHRPCAPTPLATTTTATSIDGEFTTNSPSTNSAVPFYVLVTADDLIERPTSTTGKQDEGADGKTCVSALVEGVSALLPSRTLNLRNEDLKKGGNRNDADDVLSLSQLLIGTGAPWSTPQNLPDPYLRTLPNEPGNYLYVVKTVWDAMKPSATAECALTSADELAACVTLNQLRVFFHECIDAAITAATTTTTMGEGSTKSEMQDVDAQEQEQRVWAESQQPAAPTAVAGLVDSAAKHDLEVLLAEAARERERVEQEKLREEAQRARARHEELQEKRSKREKKTNIKANNRSNFTHFRNKDFAPRQRKQERSAHQRALECYAAESDHSDDEEIGEAEDDNNPPQHHGSHHRRSSSASSSSSSGSGDGGKDRNSKNNNRNDENVDVDGGSSSDNREGGGLAAEVELLLKKATAMRAQASGRGGGRGGAKPTRGTPPLPSTAPPTATVVATTKGHGKQQKKRNKTQFAQVEEEEGNNNSEDVDKDEAAVAQLQPPRRQRKPQRKRQHQMKGDDSAKD